jgi:hypothetical protein
MAVRELKLPAFIRFSHKNTKYPEYSITGEACIGLYSDAYFELLYQDLKYDENDAFGGIMIIRYFNTCSKKWFLFKATRARICNFIFLPSGKIDSEKHLSIHNNETGEWIPFIQFQEKKPDRNPAYLYKFINDPKYNTVEKFKAVDYDKGATRGCGRWRVKGPEPEVDKMYQMLQVFKNADGENDQEKGNKEVEKYYHTYFENLPISQLENLNLKNAKPQKITTKEKKPEREIKDNAETLKSLIKTPHRIVNNTTVLIPDQERSMKQKYLASRTDEILESVYALHSMSVELPSCDMTEIPVDETTEELEMMKRYNVKPLNERTEKDPRKTIELDDSLIGPKKNTSHLPDTLHTHFPDMAHTSQDLTYEKMKNDSFYKEELEEPLPLEIDKKHEHCLTIIGENQTHVSPVRTKYSVVDNFCCRSTTDIVIPSAITGHTAIQPFDGPLCFNRGSRFFLVTMKKLSTDVELKPQWINEEDPLISIPVLFSIDTYCRCLNLERPKKLTTYQKSNINGMQMDTQSKTIEIELEYGEWEEFAYNFFGHCDSSRDSKKALSEYGNLSDEEFKHTYGYKTHKSIENKEHRTRITSENMSNTIQEYMTIGVESLSSNVDSLKSKKQIKITPVDNIGSARHLQNGIKLPVESLGSKQMRKKGQIFTEIKNKDLKKRLKVKTIVNHRPLMANEMEKEDTEDDDSEIENVFVIESEDSDSSSPDMEDEHIEPVKKSKPAIKKQPAKGATTPKGSSTKSPTPKSTTQKAATKSTTSTFSKVSQSERKTKESQPMKKRKNNVDESNSE